MFSRLCGVAAESVWGDGEENLENQEIQETMWKAPVIMEAWGTGFGLNRVLTGRII